LHLTLGIVAAALVLVIGLGPSWGLAIESRIWGNGVSHEGYVVAFLLNLAILIFGSSRYRQLRREVEVHRKAEEEALLLAETDPLTGFFNRRSFNDAVDQAIESAARTGSAIAMMMIDLDNFKQVNDYNGHQTGDLLLLEVAKRIKAVLPGDAVFGRIGGDEFAIALQFEKGRPQVVDQLAASLVGSISESARINAIAIDVTASLGLARSDMETDGHPFTVNARSMLEMADIAMYQAKRQGRNTYYWFEPPMAEEMRFRTEIENGIRNGIALGEFIPYYERQVDLQTGELVGFEMLARWDSPALGIVSPEIFIPIAEDIGAIADLSESVIAQALEDAKSWDPRLTLSVNISPLQLRDPWFAQKLLRLLVEANFPPKRLEIEITESCLHQNIGQVRSLVASLKNQGIRISLDDFGTGYSSLAQLRSLPFDRIKIDRSFVSNLIENPDSAAIVHAIAMLGKGLDLPVTAEGIESDAVLQHLRSYGPIKGQGYLYGRPRPASELAEWFENETPHETADNVYDLPAELEIPQDLEGQPLRRAASAG